MNVKKIIIIIQVKNLEYDIYFSFDFKLSKIPFKSLYLSVVILRLPISSSHFASKNKRIPKAAP